MRGSFYALALFFLCASCGSLPPRHRGNTPSTAQTEPVYRAPTTDSSCKMPGPLQRRQLLALADPHNYPRTRNKKGARNPSSSLDCSNFVHHVYQKAGMPYRFRTTSTLMDAPEFDVLPEEEGKPGDLILFRGHVGILNEDNLVISATRIRSKYQKSSITVMDRGNFPGFRGERYILRYRCLPEKIAIKSSRKKIGKTSRATARN